VGKKAKEKVQKDKQRSAKHTYEKNKDRATRTPLTEGEPRRLGRVSSSCSTSDTRRVNLVTYSCLICSFPFDFLESAAIKAPPILKSSLRQFYGRHHDLVDRYGISVSQMTTDMFHLS
jgi:hypothetical protein